MADHVARVCYLGLAAAQASCGIDRALHLAGTDRRNEPRSMVARRRNNLVEANGHRVGVGRSWAQRHRVARTTRRVSHAARVEEAFWYAATASTISFCADSGPSHPITLTHLPGSRSL